MNRGIFRTRPILETLLLVAVFQAGALVLGAVLLPSDERWLICGGAVVLLTILAWPVLLWRSGEFSLAEAVAHDPCAPGSTGHALPFSGSSVTPADRRRAFAEAGAAGLVLLGTGLIAVLGLWSSSQRTISEQFREELRNLAGIAANAVDVELHTRLAGPSPVDAAEYERAVSPFKQMLAAVPDIRYIYTAVRDGDAVRFVLDGAEPGDLNGDGVEDRAHPWELYENPDPAVLLALGDDERPGYAVSTGESFTDKWGTFVTAFAPFYDAQGRQAGVAGVDIDATHYIARLRDARARALVGLIPAAIIATAFGAGFYVVRVRSTAAARAMAAAMAALSESNQRFRNLTDASPCLTWVTDAHGRVTHMNKLWFEFTGCSSSDEQGGGWLRAVHPDDVEAFTSTFRAAVHARAGYRTEYRLRHRDGRYRNVLEHGAPNTDPTGTYHGFVGVTIDVTEHRQLERTLFAERSRLSAFVEHAPAAVAMFDRDMRYVAVSRRWLEDYRLKGTELIGACHYDVFPSIPDRWKEIHARCMLGAVESSEHDRWHADGWEHEQHLKWEVRPWIDADGSVGGIVMFTQDITAQKAVEKTLQEHNRSLAEAARENAELAAAIASVEDAVYITDATGRITYANAAIERQTGWSRGEIIGLTPAVFRSGRMETAVYSDLWSTINSGRTWKGRLLNRRKSDRTAPDSDESCPPAEQPTYWADITITPITAAGGDVLGFVAVQRDVTDAVSQENSERLAREGAEAAARISAVMAGDAPLIDRLDETLGIIFHMEQMQLHRQGEVFLLDPGARNLRFFHHQGRFISESFEPRQGVSLSGSPLARAAQLGEVVISADCLDEQHRVSGMHAHGHYHVPLMHAGVCHGVLTLCTDVKPSSDRARLDALRHIGEVIALAIVRDRTSAMLVEAREKAEAASRAKTEFLANMSHEIRTPLTAILGFADLLGDDDPSCDIRRAEAAETIRNAGRHLFAVINDILDISKIEADRMTIEHVETPLSAVLADVETMLRHRLLGKPVSLEVRLESPMPDRIISDPTRLRQILMNLAGNAAKFTQFGSITISVRTERPLGSPRLIIDVADTGPGLSDRQAASLFTPFTQADSSVTRRYGGTGLGLSICRRLALLLGGDVRLVSTAQGRGSLFRIDLPLVAGKGATTITCLAHAGSPAAAGADPQAPSLRGRILLAEDGQDNQRLVTLHLRRAGAEVTVAQNGLAALRLIDEAQAAGTPYDLLLTDMQMPEMDGYTLARTLRSRGSSIAIVALTAHAMSEDRRKCLDAGCNDYASKPIERATLLETCARWLGRPGGSHRAAA